MKTRADVLDSKKAAEYLGVSESWLNHTRCGDPRRNRPRYTKIGRRIVYRLSDLDRYLAENTR